MTRQASDPEAAWYQLSWNERRQVLQYAGRGQRHPNEHIAGIAERWATARLQPRRWKARREDGVLFLLMEVITPGGSGGSLGMLIAERRAARKNLRGTRRPLPGKST
jgi:hypothetical protein